MSTTIDKITIPTKWDIIPIHTSDRATFKFCRRQWEWSSPAKRNLIRKVRVHGVIMPLWFGTGIHHALSRFYDPVLKEDPEKVFESWFATEWDGGLVHWNELEYYADRVPTPDYQSPTIIDENTGEKVYSRWFVKGLSELLPDPDVEAFSEHKHLGIGMMHYYKDYAERNDNFRVVASEHTFSVPILTPHGNTIHWEDTRKMPEWWELNEDYGYWDASQNPMKEVHTRGRSDTILQDLETGQYGILEHKTAGRIDEDYFRHLDLDEQCTTYLWTAEREAEIYDLEYKNVDFIIYNALRKAYPKPPTMTSRGMPSIDRQKEMTTAALFEKCIKEHGLEMVAQIDPKLKAYYEYLLDMGDKLFIQRGTPEMQYVTRTKIQKENAALRLYEEAMDMLNDPRLYPNPSKNYGCLNCIFRGPCIAKERGDDYEFMLEEGFVQNYDR